MTTTSPSAVHILPRVTFTSGESLTRRDSAPVGFAQSGGSKQASGDSKQASVGGPMALKSLTAADASALKRAGLERRKGCPGLFMLRDEDGFPLVPEEHPLEGRLKTLAEHLCAELARQLRDSGTEGLPVDDFGRADLKGVWLPAQRHQEQAAHPALPRPRADGSRKVRLRQAPPT